MKRIAIWVAGILAGIVIIAVAKDVIIKTSVENGVRLVTGLRLSVRSFRVGIISSLVDIKGLRLFNPRGFKDRVMADMPEIYVKYDFPSAMSGKIHLPEARLNLREFTVVRNEKGELNLNSLKVVEAQKEDGKKAGKGKAPRIQIDSLELKIGRVVYKDYSGGGSPVVKEFNIDINERYSDIKDAYTLVSLIVVRSLTNTSIANLANFDLTGLKGTVSNTLGTAQKVALESASKAHETIKKTTETLQDIFKNPFGSSEKK